MRKVLLAVTLCVAAVALSACATTQTEDPLVGYWRQRHEECAASAPIYELVFAADGRFSVTWLPFETYKDYWGRWRHDRATDRLDLTVEGGNYIPTDLETSGVIHLDGNALTFEQISLGSPHREGEVTCLAPFRRR
jgi:hypothetical protein